MRCETLGACADFHTSAYRDVDLSWYRTVPTLLKSILRPCLGPWSPPSAHDDLTSAAVWVRVMNNRPGNLTRGGGHALLLSRRNSRRSRSPNTDDSENSRCPSPLLTVDGGYRIDPFLQYPIPRASKGVKFMTDYCE